MDPDVAEAIPALDRAGVLAPQKAGFLRRIASGELVSVHDELRLLLYAGVLLAVSGVGLLVRENLERIGPVVVAGSIGIAAAACLLWVARKAPAFSRSETASPHLAFDYLLLLGALLVAADLAYIEVSFAPLGPRWTWHLLVVAIFYAGLGFRYDSKTLLSLALTSFAAWRGISLAVFGRRFGSTVDQRAAVEAVIWGVAFVLLGVLLRRSRFKPHFEPVAIHLGWLLVFLGPVFRLGSPHGILWGFFLVVSGVGVATAAYRGRRFWLFAMGVVAAHIGMSRWIAEVTSIGTGGSLQPFLLWLVVSSVAIVLGLAVVHRRIRADR